MLSLQKILFLGSMLLLVASCRSETESTGANSEAEIMEETKMWIGTYTRKEGHVDGKAAGIYHLQLVYDKLNTLHTKEDIVNPSFVCLSPDQKYLYAVSELGPDVDSTGYVYSYRVDGDSLVFINREPTFSFAPCYVSIHPNKKWLYVANYVGGMIVRYPLADNGSILPASDRLRLEGSGPDARQEDSHPHSVTLSPDGQWLVVADLGTDIVHSYLAEDSLWVEKSSIVLPAGAGPRHIVFHPKAPYAYVVNELNSSVTAFHFNKDNGALNIIEHYPTLPENVDMFSLCADIHLTPDGKYLYASNRGHNSIIAYEVNAENGKLNTIGYFETRGDFPRHFAIDPSGDYLLVANQNTDNLVQFIIDEGTGRLIFKKEWEVKTPVCIAFSK